MPKATDWIGRRYGMLVIVELLRYTHGNSIRLYRAKCDCGNEIEVLSTRLYGRVTCCGCSRPRRRKTHGKYKTPEYRVWKAMWARVTNPNHKSYVNYGARGIVICERWKSFVNFMADMGPRPSKQHSIDRINNDGNYEPGNCHWATAKEQRLNQRPAKLRKRSVIATH